MSISTKEQKIHKINEILFDVTEKLNKLKIKKDYSKTNTQEGFLNGIIQGKTYLTYNSWQNISGAFIFAEFNLKKSIEYGNFGNAAKWKSYIEGLEICRDIIDDND